MKVHRRFGVAMLSLAGGLIVTAAVVIGVLFGTRGKSDDGQTLPVVFTISFETFGEEEIPPLSGEAGREIDLPECTREGYAFEGWFSDSEYLQVAPDRAPAKNVTYYAKFVKMYVVRFAIDGEIVTVHGKAGEEYEIPNPEKEKAEFDGWYSDAGFLNPAEPTAVFTGDETYYAKFVPVYTVRFFDGERELSSVTGRAGSNLPPLSPEKEKCVFDGWFADEKLTEPADPLNVPERDAVYFAKFTPLFTVTFFIGEGGLFSVTGRAGEELSPPDPSYAGKRFAGWYSDEARLLPASPPARIPARDCRFYAKYEKLVTLTFDTDGGSEILPVTAVSGAPLAIGCPTKEGYEFEGWTTERGGTEFVSVARMPDSDATYYAKFAKLYHVIFQSEGKETARVTGKTGTPYSAPSADAPAGFVFLGWRKDGEELAEFPAAIGTEDLVYRAAFGEIPVLRFYANPPEGKQAAGSMPAVEGIYGQVLSVALAQNAYSVSGYRFAGWADSERGAVRYRNGDVLVFDESVSLYARWAREYTCLDLPGLRVYYCEGETGAELVEEGSAQSGKAALNALGEREFEIGGYAGRFNADGTFTPRRAEYGVYDAGDGCRLFLSGYGTALLSGARTDEGDYLIEMGNLLFFRGGAFEETYRIEDDRTVLPIDNTAVYGCYYDADFTAFILGESARLGDESGIYVAGNGTISFYFHGEETRAVYSEEDGYFLYRGVYYYRAAEEIEFTGEGISLTFRAGGAYPVSATFAVADEPVRSGELTEAGGGLFSFSCRSGGVTERFLLRLSYGGRVARVAPVQSETITVWRNESDAQKGTLYTEEFCDYEKGRRTKTLYGEIAAADGNPLVLPERELDPDSAEAEYALDRDGVSYRVRLELFLRDEARLFRCAWYGVKAAELLSPDGGYRLAFEQFAGSENEEAYEGMTFGVFLSFRLFAGETPLNPEYAFTLPNDASVFHVLSGEFAGQYLLRFSFGGGLLVGFSCEKKETLISGNYLFVRRGNSFESLYDLDGEKELIPLLYVAPLCEGAEKLCFGESVDDCLEFAYERETENMTHCCTRVYESNGFTVTAVVGAAGERAYTVRISEGETELGAAALSDGVWVYDSEFSSVEVRFSDDCAEATARRVMKIFGAENPETGIALTYTLKGAEELGEILSASIGDTPLELCSCELLELGGSSGYYVRATDPRAAEKHFILRLTDGTGEVEKAEQYTAQDGNAKVSIVYGEGWYFLLPALELYSESSGKAVFCRGALVRESERVWALSAGEAGAVEIEVTRKSNLLAPFAVEVRNLPELVTGEDESGEIFAEAAVLFGEDGNLSVFSLRTQEGEFTPKGEEIAFLGGGRWYFSGFGLVLNAEDGLAYLEQCGEPFSVVGGEFTVELAEVGFSPIPLRFLIGGEAQTGIFTELASEKWLWEGNGERYTLVFTADYGELEVIKG